jgi:hypothetical protein
MTELNSAIAKQPPTLLVNTIFLTYPNQVNKCIIGKKLRGGKIHMLVFLFQGLLALTSTQAVASDPVNLRGYISFRGEQPYVVDFAEQTYALYPLDSEVAADLRELEAGDYIEGRAMIGTSTAVVEAIEFIGLKRLLGKWVDKNKKIVMDFKNFSQATIRTPKDVKVLDYALSPDEKNRYTIFLGNKQVVVIGILSHFTTNIRIELINSQTGQIEETMKLSAVRN